jgi:hypothetical protein
MPEPLGRNVWSRLASSLRRRCSVTTAQPAQRTRCLSLVTCAHLAELEAEATFHRERILKSHNKAGEIARTL